MMKSTPKGKILGDGRSDYFPWENPRLCRGTLTFLKFREFGSSRFLLHTDIEGGRTLNALHGRFFNDGEKAPLRGQPSKATGFAGGYLLVKREKF